MKKESGITLIALVITIIVMLILVLVTINVAMTGGLFENSREAAFKTEAAQIKESAEIKRAEVLAENLDTKFFSYGINDLDNVSDKTKEKFIEKLVINELDGKVYYLEEKVTQEEATWLEQVGIKPYNPGIYDYEDIIGSVLDKNPNAFIYPIVGRYQTDYTNPLIGDYFVTLGGGTTSSNQLDTLDNNDNYKRLLAINRILYKYEQTGGDFTGVQFDVVEPTDNPIQQEINAVLTQYPWPENSNSQDWSINDDALDAYTLQMLNYLIIDNNKVTLLGYEVKKDMTNSKQIMSIEEFDRNFAYISDYAFAAGGNDKIAITGYIGNDTNIVIPQFVYDTKNKKVFEVIGTMEGNPTERTIAEHLNYFMFGGSLTESEFNSYTVEQLETIAGNITSQFSLSFDLFTYDESLKNSTDLAVKNREIIIPLIKYMVLTMQGKLATSREEVDSVSDAYYRIDPTTNYLYIYSENGNVVPAPRKNFEEVVMFVGRCTEDNDYKRIKLKKGLLANIPTLEKVTIITGNGDSVDADNVFYGCNNLEEINMVGFGLDGSGSDTIYSNASNNWGASNPNPEKPKTNWYNILLTNLWVRIEVEY